MKAKPVIIINKLGLHARAATKLVNLASQFAAETQLIKDHQTINDKSIMGVMMLAASKGTKLTVTCAGEDENQALEAIVALINDRFGEAE